MGVNRNPNDTRLDRSLTPMCPYSYGIFRLTEPGGLTTIINCRHSALFHEHTDIKGGIYTDADHGHVRLTSSLPPLEVIDLRRK